MKKKVLSINGSQVFAHSGGALNKTISGWNKEFFECSDEFEIAFSDVNKYDLATEVQKFSSADIIIYHFPVWWFSMPHNMKSYLDHVLTAGHRKGMYYSDGRKQEFPEINYGTGGLMHGKKYMVSTTWNAPETAFTLPGEFFQERSVDDGVLFGFHRMNAFLALSPLKSFHFHDVEKNMSDARLATYRQQYLDHLATETAFQAD